MRFDSYQFIGFSLIAIMLLRIVRVGSFRDFLLALLNCYFIYSFSIDNIYLVPLFLFVLVGYFSTLLAKNLRTFLGIGITLTSLIAIFIWLKRYSVIDFLPTLDFPYLTIGLSYILFRIIHLIIDVSQGAIRVPGFLAYFNYIFFFLNFVSGPIQRYQDFSEQNSHPEPCKTVEQIYLSLARVITGFFMVIVVCSYTSFLSKTFSKYFYIAFISDVDGKTVILFAIVALIQLIHLYINFAGYMHICIGIGRLSGFSLPENFNAPHKAHNFLDLWARWHITLSEWFKFYLFNPVLKYLMHRWGDSTVKNSQYFGVVAFFATFLTMGIWHGSTYIFIFYGLLLGSGVAFNKLWQIQMSKHLGKKQYKALCQQDWYSQLSRALALSFFAIALTCIWVDPDQVNRIASIQGILCGALAFLVICGFLFTILLLTKVLQSLHWVRFSNFAGSPIATAFVIGFKLFVIVNFVVLVNSGAPDFIYQGF